MVITSETVVFYFQQGCPGSRKDNSIYIYIYIYIYMDNVIMARVVGIFALTIRKVGISSKCE